MKTEEVFPERNRLNCPYQFKSSSILSPVVRTGHRRFPGRKCSPEAGDRLPKTQNSRTQGKRINNFNTCSGNLKGIHKC